MATHSQSGTALSYQPAHLQNVAEFLLFGKEPSQAAIVLPTATHSYGELQSCVKKVASWVVQHSDPGARVVIAASNSFFWVAAYLGTMLAGRVAVPIAPEISSKDLSHVLSITEAQAGMLQDTFAANHDSDSWGLPLLLQSEFNVSLIRGISDIQADQPFPQSGGNDLAALMFTSGSTGTPRGVMISHRNIIANTHSIVEYLNLTSNDRAMVVLPFHYCFGASLLHTHLLVGGTLVFDNSFMYPELFLRRLFETNCTVFAGVPSHYQILLRRSGLRKHKFPALRLVQQAGGHLTPALLQELREALPDSQICAMYGQTEATARLSYLPPELLDSKAGSIGRAIPGVSLMVLNDEGDLVNPGEIGEIVAEGDNVACGYWREPEETAKCFRGKRLFTGDLATIDSEGFLYITGRTRDFVKCGSKRVSCRFIEDTLLGCEELVEVGVVGVEDDILGEAVQAFVVPRDPDMPSIEEHVFSFCKKHLPLLLRPRHVVVLESLPKNSSGKVLKSVLKQVAANANRDESLLRASRA